VGGFVVTAINQHALAADEDPDALTFELNGIILAANSSFVLFDDPKVLEMPRNLLRRRLGIPALSAAEPSRGARKRK